MKKMSSTLLHGSANYIWFETDVLGQGATGSVYRARHKRSGEVLAVKTFNQMSHLRPLDVQMREFQVLQKVNHENIVKLLGVEEDSLTNTKVIVMELCTGGSLYTLLEEPVNSFGFEEQDFFTVMNDVANGLKHLRELGIVHRDIKPGNILLYTGLDGRHIYKLTDFGAARELEEEEQFMSLYGTEEYLFPDMYARAVLSRDNQRKFDASVDLWSLGVTLYHVATGSLPFRPYGGRSNKHTMYQMTSNKESGVISGVQHEPNGAIEFSQQLPKTCRLSKGAQMLITPILAGLMESKVNKIWSFDEFFDKVYIINQKKLIYIFNTSEAIPLHIFLDPTDKLTQLHDAIARQTDLPINQQDLIFDHANLIECISPSFEVTKYPNSSQRDPYFLFVRPQTGSSLEFSPLASLDVPKPPPTIAGMLMNLNSDFTHVKTIEKIMYYIIHQMNYYHKCQEFLSSAARVFLFILCANITRILTFTEQFSELVEETEKRVNWFRVHQSKLVESLRKSLEGHPAATDDINMYMREGEKILIEIESKLKKISCDSKQASIGVRDFHTRLVIHHELSCDHIKEQSCANQLMCKRRHDVLYEEVHETVVSFKNDKKKRSLSHNEEQIHKFEKNKARDNCQKATKNLLENCYGKTRITFRIFSEWFKWSCEVRSKLQIYEDNLKLLSHERSALSQEIDVSFSQHFDRGERISQKHKNMTNGHGDVDNDFVVFNREDFLPYVESNGASGYTRTPSLNILKTQLASLKLGTEDIKQELKENTEILQELQQLVDDNR